MTEPLEEIERPALRGREPVLDLLSALLNRAAAGHGEAITLVGEAGIGKTAVLDEFADMTDQLNPECRLVRLTGVEAEVEMAWSGLAALLSGLLGHLDRLPPARAAAVRSALALAGAPEARVEEFAVALAARDLLVESAEQAPVVVLVDDSHWIDVPTRRTLAYIARRLELERLFIVSTRRPGADGTDTGPIRTLTPVGEAAATGILQDVGVTSADVRRHLVSVSGGIPLVLVEAAGLLNADQRAGRSELPDPMPIGASGQRVVDLVVGRLTSHVRDTLVVAAAEPDGRLDRILEALGTHGKGLAELEAAENGGVILIEDDRLSFRHPLMRSAVYHDAAGGERRAAHRALAGTLPEGSAARALHLARAAAGPDEEVAGALDDAASETARRGAPSTAARSWELASRLSPAPIDRVRRLRLAAGAILDAGMAEAAGRLLDRADAVIAEHPASDDAVERVRRRQLRCHLPATSGGVTNPAAALRAAAADIAELDPAVAVDLLLDALSHHVRAGELNAILSLVEELAPQRDALDAERGRRVDVIAGAVHVAAGREDGEPLLARYLEMVGPARSAADVLYLAEVVAPVLAFLRRTKASDELLAELDADLRARGAVWPLVSVLNAQTLSQYGRSLPATMSAGLEAVALAEGNGIPHHASISAGVLALCAAVVGDRAACERAARLLCDAPEPERQALAGIGLGFLALNEGRLDDADAHYREVRTLSPIGHGVVRWEPEWIEALLRSGRRADAEVVFRELEAATSDGPLAFPRIARAQGLMATDDDEAVKYFAAAVEDAVAIGNRAVEGRCEMSWGERLRRARKRAEARQHLERALALFREVGAALLAERATNELRAAGGVVGDEVISHQLLTPHELQVARLVVGGASNRELAAKLFISPRTVEAHLTSIFRKLRVRNRRELSARALDDPILQP